MIFVFVFFINTLIQDVKINERVNKFLLKGDTFMTDMHLRELRFTYNAYVILT